MTLYHMLRCVAFVLTLVATQHNARIDLDPILAFLCFASLRLITKKSLKYLIRSICVSQINATQGLASHYEPAFLCSLFHLNVIISLSFLSVCYCSVWSAGSGSSSLLPVPGGRSHLVGSTERGHSFHFLYRGCCC